MIRIAVTSEDLANIRFAISPMMVTVQSVRAYLYPQYITGMSDWLDTIKFQLGDCDLQALRQLLPMGKYIADFMLPFPAKSQMNFEDELEAVASMPIDTIGSEIQALLRYGNISVADLDGFKYARALAAQAVDELEFFWEHVMQPHWDGILTVLEGDLMYRSRALMTGGASNMFDSLGRDFSLDTTNLITIGTKTNCEMPLDAEGLGVVLMPNLVSGCGVWFQKLENKPPVIIYPAFGAGLWKRKTALAPSEAMMVLFGDNRSRLLQELLSPTSTKDLALKLGLTSGAVSQQLSQLRDAGLVTSNRSGRSVYYYLNNRGEQLVKLLSTA